VSALLTGRVLASGLTDFLGDAVDLQVQVDSIGLGAVFALMAVGIGLVFGVLRLVNFAYGQLIMAGGFALAFASERGWPVAVGIVLCVVVVLALSLAMERAVFRPLRGQSPAVMLIATFAVAFLLQSIALLWFGPLGKTAASLADLNRPVSLGDVEVRKITIVAIVAAAVCLGLVVLLLNRTSIGLHMRAAAMDFHTARLVGVRANLVSAVAVLVAGALAAVVAVILTVQYPTVTPTFALRETITVLAGVVVGGMTRLLPATLGGFAIGYVSGILGGALPTAQSQYLPSFVFGLVILVLLVRPGGLFTRGGQAVERV
jgi:branched-chain amino acid transport system permease protein